MNFNESQTRKNLAKSFAAECQAGARYEFMATQAQNEELFYVKDTMKAIAKNEMAHAKLFYDYIVKYSKQEDMVEFDADFPYVSPKLDESLKSESLIEKSEFEKIYPLFASVAREEGYTDIAESFLLVAKIENSHSKILEHLNKLYKNGAMYESKSKKVLRCTNCGHLGYGSGAWKTCPVCSLGQGYIMIDYATIFEECAKD